MSETIEAQVPEQEPAPPAESTAEPEAQAAEQATAEQQQAEEQQKAEADKEARRIARLTGRVSALARERDELAARIAALEQARQGAQDGQWSPEQQQAIEAAAQRLAAQRLAQERRDAFHEQGREAYPDWQDRCQSLMAMGADPGFAELLVEMRDGAKVAAALAEDPDEVERIAGLKTERARAIALGQFAAKLAARPPPPAKRVSNAPPPIRPVTGRVNPQPNEYTMTAEQLVELYSQREMEARRARR